MRTLEFSCFTMEKFAFLSQSFSHHKFMLKYFLPPPHNNLQIDIDTIFIWKRQSSRTNPSDLLLSLKHSGCSFRMKNASRLMSVMIYFSLFRLISQDFLDKSVSQRWKVLLPRKRDESSTQAAEVDEMRDNERRAGSFRKFQFQFFKFLITSHREFCYKKQL